MKTSLEHTFVYDDILEESNLETLAQFFQDASWKFGWGSNTLGESFKHWNIHFAGGGKSSLIPCEDDLYADKKLHPIAALWEIIREKILPNHNLVRCYGNAHSFGLDGTIHRDNDEAIPLVTSVVYCHRLWPIAWGGEIILYNTGCDSIETVVHPKPGRLIVFNGCTPHVVKSPARMCRELRISLVFKSINKNELLRLDRCA